MKFTKEISDNLKSQPLEVQLRTLIEYVDNEVDIKSNKDNYLPFADLLKELQVANKAVKTTWGDSRDDNDFYQQRVDYVLNKRKEKTV